MDQLTSSDGSKGIVRPRINGDLMTKFMSKQVHILGKATEVENNGVAFKLITSDNITVTVHLHEPYDGIIDGFVEVFGKVTSKTSVLCDNLAVVPPEHTDNFDFSHYNEAVNFLHTTHYYGSV